MAKKLNCSALSFTLGVSLFFTLVFNALFIINVWAKINFKDIGRGLFAASVPLVLFSAFLLIFSLLTLPWLRKPLVILLTLVSSAAIYFIFSFGTVIDTNMVQNVFETDAQEATALFSPRLLVWNLIFGILPSLFILRLHINPAASLKQALLTRLLCVVCALAVIVLMALFFYKDYASLFRNNKSLVKMVTPVNVISGVSNYTRRHAGSGSLPWVHIGEDAQKGPVIRAQRKKTLVVLVVGETARAENFSLGGYRRDTNPKLAAQAINYFEKARSCGTETAISLPCLFSSMSRRDYDASLARRQDGVMDILSHAGVQLLWRENNGSCKGACDRIPHTTMVQWKLPDLCTRSYCFDEALLWRLNPYIESLRDDAVIVLHQIGSHGPAYYKRYPQNMRRFQPTCDTNQIQDCDSERLVNTYDNTLLYTDSMLSDTIDLLKSWQGKLNVAMIYLSDHGESLGEHGMYLHGAPYLFAPSQQTHIPFLFWLSPGYRQAYGIDEHCMAEQARNREVSHDNLFHTLLGMLDIRTREYKPQLDILRACKS